MCLEWGVFQHLSLCWRIFPSEQQQQSIYSHHRNSPFSFTRFLWILLCVVCKRLTAHSSMCALLLYVLVWVLFGNTAIIIRFISVALYKTYQQEQHHMVFYRLKVVWTHVRWRVQSNTSRGDMAMGATKNDNAPHALSPHGSHARSRAHISRSAQT